MVNLMMVGDVMMVVVDLGRLLIRVIFFNAFYCIIVPLTISH